jgi:hypothetical protein
MKRIIPLITVISMLLGHSVQGQPKFLCDALGNSYEVSADNLTKHSTNFNIDFRLSTLQYGTSAQLDLTNPLVPFLFFQDQSSLVFFDNNLNVLQDPIFLNEKFQGQITCVAGSKGDALWLYDINSSTLIRTNRKFEILSQSANLSYLTKFSLQPIQIIENGQRVYLIDAENGILLFSIFGNLELKSAFKTSDPVYQWNNSIIFRMENVLYSWKNNALAPTTLCQLEVGLLNEENTWMICEGKPFYVERKTGIKREIPLLENFEK